MVLRCILIIISMAYACGLKMRWAPRGISRFGNFSPSQCGVGPIRSQSVVNYGRKLPRNGLGSSSINRIVRKKELQESATALSMIEVPEFGDDDDDFDDADEKAVSGKEDDRTDMEKGLTHGYEGNFKVGDAVRVKAHCQIYSVIPLRDDGFDACGLTGKIVSLEMYGKKHKSLCSAITPLKCLFEPGNEGVPDAIQRRFFLHFDKDEVELM
jgi:hypothetical protein